jgi:hypothetical protein
MKFLVFAAITLFLGGQTAVAQPSECSTVPKARDRLACYDRITPPTPAKSEARKQKAAPSTTSSDQGKAVDALAVENSKLNAKLKTICRGC